MAKRFTVAELIVRIKADIKQMKIGLREGVSEVKGFGKDVGKATSQLNRFGRGMGLVSAVMVAGGIKAVRVFAALEQAIANTASVTGGTTAEVKHLEAFARKMGKTTVYTATQAGDAMYYLASAGYDATQIFSSLDSILALAAATQYDLAEVTATVVSTLRAFSMEADEATRVTNVFAAAISSSQATMFKLSESMKYIAPVAANLNYTIEETTAALSLLYNSGLEASMAGTQLRMALTRLQRPTKAAHMAMKEMEIDFKNLNPAFNDLVDIVGELEDANAGAAKSGRMMAEIFGVRAVNAMNILSRNGSSALEEMIDSITGTTKAADMQQRQIDTLKGTWRLMVSAMQETSIIIGSVLEPALKAIMESVRQLNLWFADMPSILQKIVVGGGALVTTFAGLGSILLLLLAKLPKLATGVRYATKMWSLFGKRLFWVLGVIHLVLSAITFLTSAEERAARKRKTFVLDYSNYLNAKIQDAKNTIRLADKLHELAKASKDNITKQRQMARTIKRLNALHPKLIDNEKELTTQLGRVNEAASEAEETLRELIKRKERLREFKIATDLARTEESIKKIKADLDSISLGENLTELFRGMIPSGITTGIRKEVVNDISAINQELGDAIGLTSGIGATIAGQWTPNLLSIQRILNELTRTEEGREELLRIQSALRLGLFEHEQEELSILDKTCAVEELISGTIDTKLGKQKDLVMAYDIICGQVTSTLEKTEVLEALEIRRLKLLDQQAKKAKEAADASTPTEDPTMRAQRLAEKRLELEILTATLSDRIKLREKSFEIEAELFKGKLEAAGYMEKHMTEIMSAWRNKKELENTQKTEDEKAALEMSIATYSTMNVFTMRMKRLEDWRRKTLREAKALGGNRNAIIQAYDEEMTRIQVEEEHTRQKLLHDIWNQTASMKVGIIRNVLERTEQQERINHTNALADVEQFEIDMEKRIIDGLVSRSAVEDEAAKRRKVANTAHTQAISDIERSGADRQRVIAEDLTIDKLKALADYNLAGEDALEYDLEQERIANKVRGNNLEKWLDEKLILIEQEEADAFAVEEAYTAQSDANERKHQSNKAAIRLEYDIEEKERELLKLDDESALYDKALDNLLVFLKSKLDALKGNAEAHIKLLRLIQQTEDEILNRQKDKYKKQVAFVGTTFQLIGEAAGKAGQGMTDAWKESLKSFVKMAAASARSKALAELALSWKVPPVAAKWLVTIAAISAAEQVALGRINAAQYGAKVKEAGLLEVHAGETVVPAGIDRTSPIAARIERSTWEQYAADYMKGARMPEMAVRPPAVAATGTSVESKTFDVTLEMNVNAEGMVLSPADDEISDLFYERFIRPAEGRFKEVMESTVNEALAQR